MKLSILLLMAVLTAGAVARQVISRENSDQTVSQALDPPPAAGKVGPARIKVEGTRFVQGDGKPFEWRGVTAFRLVEFVASGREAEAAAYLDWAASNGITVVRVLTMAHHLFNLTPADGLRALPRLLELAAERGTHVEVVALADTAEHAVDLDAHVIAIGKIAAMHPNAFVEIANEPFHGTQHPSLHHRATLARLAALIPEEVVVAFGSDAPDSSGGGDYVTVHLARGDTPWEHVKAIAEGHSLVAKYGRPVVSDEPIGAAATLERGRRDNSPERFRAAALLTRMTGMHATFHYEGGLQARIPQGPEKACFEAWSEAWTLLPAGIEAGAFSQRAAAKGALYETRLGDRTWVLAVDGARVPAGMKALVSGPASTLATSGPAAATR